MKKFLVAVIIVLLTIFVIVPKVKEHKEEKSNKSEMSNINQTVSDTKETTKSWENNPVSYQDLLDNAKNQEEQPNEPEAEEQQTQQNENQQAQDMQTQTSKVKEPKAVLIENEYKMKERTPQIYESVYDTMSGKVLKLNKAGKVTILLFGEVSLVYVTSDESNYSSFYQVTLAVAENTAEEYYTFEYECTAGSKKMFQIVMMDGSEYFFSVQKT